MQLTRAADYAVRVMIQLASSPDGSVISKATLAKGADAPESFLSKILQALTHAGLIQARRGVVGGFFLLPRGEQASLLDVVEAIDGPISLNVCVTSGISCHRSAKCSAHTVWVEAQEAMLAVLRGAKIADMARGDVAHPRATVTTISEAPLKSPDQSTTTSRPPEPARTASSKQNIRN